MRVNRYAPKCHLCNELAEVYYSNEKGEESLILCWYCLQGLKNDPDWTQEELAEFVMGDLTGWGEDVPESREPDKYHKV